MREPMKLYNHRAGRKPELIGIEVADEQFLALTADELRDAIRAGGNDWVFRNGDERELCLYPMADSDHELTEEEFNALTSHELRKAILNTTYDDVYCESDGKYVVFDTCNTDYNFSDDDGFGGQPEQRNIDLLSAKDKTT
jgi:hypothetical protein